MRGNRGYYRGIFVILDWNHIYILAWYDPYDGTPYLTTWHGDLPTVTVHVTGPSVRTYGPPMWSADHSTMGFPYEMFTLHEEKVPRSVKAHAWYVEEGFNREKEPTGIIPRWGIDSTGGA